MNSAFRCAFVPLLLVCALSRAATGLAPDAAVKAFELPPGVTASLVAVEPTVTQPVAFDFDDRGRLWVAEFLSYPTWAPEGHDRIVMLTGGANDGTLDTRNVIWEKGNYVTSFALGYGGIWVTTPPSLLFIPCDFNADIPVCGTPKVILDGWSHAGTHNIVNGLTWGPDGWLYGCNGISSRSRVGPPGTAPSARTFIDGGVWRFHIPTGKLESVCTGGTNMWGLDWDARGEMFTTNNVTAHIFHVIPGARFERSHETDQNPYTYELMHGCADHKHYAGTSWKQLKGSVESQADLGGGHSHVGEFICRGDEFGPAYRNSVFMFNTHGNRINRDVLEVTPTGTVARHAPDFCLTHDKSFRGVSLKIGPDNALYLSDWHQDGECHSGTEVDSGRIFKFDFGTTVTPSEQSLAADESADLVRMITQPTLRWQAAHAARILFERAAKGPLDEPAMQLLHAAFEAKPGFVAPLNYAGYVLLECEPKYIDQRLLFSLMQPKPVFAMEYLVHVAEPTPECEAILKRLFLSAVSDGDSFLRLASVIQRAKWAAKLKNELLLRLSIVDSADDRNCALMLWYAAEPLVETQRDLAHILIASPSSMLHTFTVRRIAESSLAAALNLIASEEKTAPADLLRGLDAALKGRAHIDQPKEWPALKERFEKNADPEVLVLTRKISAVFGDAVSLKELRAIASDKTASVVTRRNALESLLSANDPELLPLAQKLVGDLDLRGDALHALARFDDPQTAPLILKTYAKFDPADKAAALATLAARPSTAETLFAALKKKEVAASDLDSPTVRQLQALALPELDAWLEQNWGQSRPSAADKQNEIARLKGRSEAGLKNADAARGQAVFKKTCAACHTLFAEGGKVGPDLTGSARANLDYLLLNIVDPNAIVPQEYMAWNFKTKDGRVLTGLLRNETAESLDVVNGEGTVTLRVNDIKIKRRSNLSMMPEGILNGLSDEAIWDLMAYLQSK